MWKHTRFPVIISTYFVGTHILPVKTFAEAINHRSHPEIDVVENPFLPPLLPILLPLATGKDEKEVKL